MAKKTYIVGNYEYIEIYHEHEKIKAISQGYKWHDANEWRRPKVATK